MEKYRCIALDLDGTLLADDGSLSPASRRTLEEAMASGVHVVVASGRAFSTLPSCITSIPGIEYAITSNGAAVYRMPGAECLCVHKLKTEAVKRVLEIAGRELEQPLYEAFIDGCAYAPADYVEHPERYGLTGRSASYVQSTRKPCADFAAFLEAHMGELDSLDLVFQDQSEKKRIWEILERETEHIYITASVPRLLEISDELSGKAQALSYVLDRLGLTARQAAAFGNADNDADMLRFAGLGIAVENATEQCRKAADRVVESNNEEGAAREIRRLLALP
ncbi:MAG TPA: Cof-type HAD-IIB family hydrolase [Firmicutes bacterium]|nr:Cof-type HAD-IIB family hydrolase [Bacillota bacterium]